LVHRRAYADVHVNAFAIPKPNLDSAVFFWLVGRLSATQRLVYLPRAPRRYTPFFGVSLWRLHVKAAATQLPEEQQDHQGRHAVAALSYSFGHQPTTFHSHEYAEALAYPDPSLGKDRVPDSCLEPGGCGQRDSGTDRKRHDSPCAFANLGCEHHARGDPRYDHNAYCMELNPTKQYADLSYRNAHPACTRSALTHRPGADGTCAH
jgi:hypothetical protein